MFILENPQILWLLLLIVPFAAGFYLNLRRKRRAVERFKGAGMEKQLPDYSIGKQHLKFTLLMLTYALMVFALANPQLGTSLKKAERKGIDVMIALDISTSMNCNDIQPSRLMRAKQAVMRIIDKMQSDRIGLVIFAGDAYLQLPLTTDYGAAKLFINNVQTSDLSRQGTAIGAAIRLCAENFDPKYEKNKNKAIIVISDGENHEDDAVGAASEVAKKGILVSTVGMGTVQGAPIPEYRNGQLVSYKKDRNSQVVVTRINREMLQNIARAGDGFYVEANNVSSGVETVFEKLSQLDKVSFESQNISDYETRYQYVALLALLLLVLEIFIFEKQNKVFNRSHLFGKRKAVAGSVTAGGMPAGLPAAGRMPAAGGLPAGLPAAALLMVTGILLSAAAASTASAQKAIPTHKGNKFYADSLWGEAKVSYLRALDADSTYYKALYNMGNSEYRMYHYPQAAEMYNKALENPALSRTEKADAYHNLGNSLFRAGDYQNAVNAYINALRNQPGREDTRYNLAYAQQMLQKQQQQQQQNQQNKDKNQDKDKDKQQQQNQQQNKQQQQQQQQQQPGQDQKDKQQSPQQQQQQKQKEQDAERMLRALENQEKNTLEKVKKQEIPARGRQTDKDW